MKRAISVLAAQAGSGVQIGCCVSPLLTRIFSPIVDLTGLRAEFPVLERLAYLNAGTDGPLPARAVQAASEELARELRDGRAGSHFERRKELTDALRDAYALALGCPAGDVALTTSTSEGMAQVIAGMAFEPGQEILTSDEEHPGLLGLLAGARDIHGVQVRMVPLAEIAQAVGPRTALVACSHVSWMTGSLAPAELADVKAPVLLDGAQGLGAVHLDMAALGCDAYAGAGQKWMCGPDGTGALYVSPAFRERLAVPRRGYANLADPGEGLEAALHEDARRFDTPSLAAEATVCALAGAQILQEAGWDAVHERSRALAATLAEMLTEHGRAPLPRGPSTLVSFPSEDAEAERERLAGLGVVVRNIPGRPWLRASVGVWNDEGDLERLVQALRC
jgi:selenocysteine lyase/cysteine desulfurase